jgi:molybdopterin-guanine dinucleotide biosynthesis protein A
MALSGTDATLAGIVLAGGRSSRMGTAKAALDWHGTSLVHRTASVLARVADPIVVVRAPDQHLPSLPPGVEVVVDRAEGRGPLEGMAAGMRAIGDRADAAFVAATDMPMLHPEFIRSIAAALGDADVALPVIDGHNHPLAAVYRTALRSRIEDLLGTGRLRPAYVWEDAVLNRVDERSARHPESVRNVNTPDELAAVRALPLPLIGVDVYGTVRTHLGFARTEVHAATLGAALDALAAGGRARDHHDALAAPGPDALTRPNVLVALNGERFRSDRSTALVDGDRLALLAQEAGG